MISFMPVNSAVSTIPNGFADITIYFERRKDYGEETFVVGILAFAVRQFCSALGAIEKRGSYL